MSAAIKLNLINRSNCETEISIVIFAKNVAAEGDEFAIAWKVIQNCGQSDNHPFRYPLTSQFSFSDRWGNRSSLINAEPGEQLAVKSSRSGEDLSLHGAAANGDEIEVLNLLDQGSIDALMYKSGKLYSQRTDVAPNHLAVFECVPTIWIGVAAQVEEGQPLNSAIIAHARTRLSLLGLTSADIIMTGGDSNAHSTPFDFQLENVVPAESEG